MSSREFVDKLKESRILIFGATSGLGFAVSEARLEYGATPIITGSNQPNLNKTIERLRSAYSELAKDQIQSHVCDLAHPDALEANLLNLLKAATNDGANKLNHVVFTAGDPLPMKPFAEFTPADIQKAGIVRFITPLMIAKLIPTFVVTSPGSSFTITGGVIGTKSPPGWTAIAEYASAAEGVTRGLAVGLAPVRVNCVSPGSVMTEMHAHDPKQMIDYLTNATLTKRLGRPEDMAEGYLYSIKDRYVSGAILNSNGGALLV